MINGPGSIGTKKGRIEDQVRDVELKNWATPTTMTTIENRSADSMIKNLTGGGRRKRTSPHTLQEQVDPYKVEVAKRLNLYFQENPSAEVPSEKELKNWATPRVHTPGENVNKLYNKDGSIWDQVGPMYRPSGTIGGTNLQLQAQLEDKKSEPMEDNPKNWGTPTTSQLQLNESLDSYLRRSKKRIDNNKSVFPTQLTFEVEAEESDVDIKKELEEHKKTVKKN